jgi:hypothetical protein
LVSGVCPLRDAVIGRLLRLDTGGGDTKGRDGHRMRLMVPGRNNRAAACRTHLLALKPTLQAAKV